jgi:hypothetical protein
MRVRPAPGRTLRDPETRQLVTDDGIEVRDADPYWRRRLRDGDAVRVEPPTAARHKPHKHEGA